MTTNNRRVFNQVRTDVLEGLIANYQAIGYSQAAEAIRSLAISIGAPIDETVIESETESRRAFYNDYFDTDDKVNQILSRQE